METMETVIENVKDVAPAEAAQTVVKVATTKPSINVAKAGGIAAGIVALVGVGYGIYRAIKAKKTIPAIEPGCEAEHQDDSEPDED